MQSVYYFSCVSGLFELHSHNTGDALNWPDYMFGVILRQWSASFMAPVWEGCAENRLYESDFYWICHLCSYTIDCVLLSGYAGRDHHMPVRIGGITCSAVVPVATLAGLINLTGARMEPVCFTIHVNGGRVRLDIR